MFHFRYGKFKKEASNNNTVIDYLTISAELQANKITNNTGENFSFGGGRILNKISVQLIFSAVASKIGNADLKTAISFFSVMSDLFFIAYINAIVIHYIIVHSNHSNISCREKN